MNSKPLTRCYDRLYRLIGCCCQISKIREDDKTSKETGETIAKSYNQRISVRQRKKNYKCLTISILCLLKLLWSQEEHLVVLGPSTASAECSQAMLAWSGKVAITTI